MASISLHLPGVATVTRCFSSPLHLVFRLLQLAVSPVYRMKVFCHHFDTNAGSIHYKPTVKEVKVNPSVKLQPLTSSSSQFVQKVGLIRPVQLIQPHVNVTRELLSWLSVESLCQSRVVFLIMVFSLRLPCYNKPLP